MKTSTTKRAAPGFSLIEVVVAMAVILVAFVTIFTGMSIGLSSMQASRENLRATQIMLDKMEGVRLYSWAQLTNSTFLVPSFTNWFYETNNIGLSTATGSGDMYTGAVAVAAFPFTASYGGTMRSVTVNVGWVSGSITHSRSMSTFVSENGMQNYIYNSN
jgi:uncharacterized protein (TIGR02598 family)